ncbi:uncharacterized protein LOC131936800 [Physella acuta]|uniref:uncharacterized protein LOC131936800 n=1 Tax=Physella acuta TaxID=109671 RepID=UPI0027DC4212|nr:uncharacterized protein LOC131936800 [Physella acuta]
MTTAAVEELVTLIETSRDGLDDDVEALTRVLNTALVPGECVSNTEICSGKFSGACVTNTEMCSGKISGECVTKTDNCICIEELNSKLQEKIGLFLNKDLIQSRLVQLVIITQLLQKSEQGNPSTDDIQEIYSLLIRMLHLLEQRLSPQVNLREVIQNYVPCNYDPDVMLREAKLHIGQSTLRYILMIKIREMLTKWRANIWFCELQAT